MNVFVLPLVAVLLGDQLSWDAGEAGMLGKIRYDLTTPLTIFAFLLTRDLVSVRGCCGRS